MTQIAPSLRDPAEVTARIWGRDVRFAITDPADLIQAHHAAGGFYEPEELEIIRQYCRPGSVFADIGANIGNHTLFAGLFLHPARLIPFEVNPAAVAILSRNLEINGLTGLCDLRHLGVGLADQSSDDASLTQPGGNMGGARVSPHAGDLRLRRGDALLAGQPVDFLKIDVEGMELAVLSGLGATIATCRPRIFIEVDDANAAAFQDWVAANGYTIADRFRRYRTNENFMLLSAQDPATLARKALLRALARKQRRKAGTLNTEVSR